MPDSENIVASLLIFWPHRSVFKALKKAPKGAFFLALRPLWSSSGFLEAELLSFYGSWISL